MQGEDGGLAFHALPTPTSGEVSDIARRTAKRLHQAFRKKRRHSPWDDEDAFVDSGESDPFSLEQPGLFACYQAAASGVAVSGEHAGQPVLRLLAGGAPDPAAFRALGASLPVTFSRSPGPHFAAGELCAVSVTSQRILNELMTKTRGASN